MTIVLKLTLTDRQALDLARLVRRFGFVDAYSCADDRDEAYRMLEVTGKIQQALAEEGVPP